MARRRSSYRPSLISPWIKLIGFLTIGHPAVITLKIHLNYDCDSFTGVCIMWDSVALCSFKQIGGYSQVS